MNVRGNIPTKFSLGIFRGHFRQTSGPRNFLGSLFPRNSVGKFRGISEERINSEELFPTTCFVALLQAAALNYRHICIKSDSQVLVDTISACRKSTDLFGVLADIDDLAFSTSSPFQSYRFFFISRSLNGLADGLAKNCLATHLISNPSHVT
ncbi:hypothetical protein F2Q70_00016097 [Brassica cretica]|uniref:RNase H type-1 domain-containing protein n=1 Tax=Brassica cretica TaxID=69181 RepID=A0A8S9I368_BRACR|nr:hypothetical protein F2Q70_00016097 [Brassica cretica]